MAVGSSDENNVVLVADELLRQQQPNMNLFIITESHLIQMSNPKEGVMMVIKFKRKITSEMMTTYLPSVLLMMITYATTFFKPFFFEAALSVNLTTMLVMTTRACCREVKIPNQYGRVPPTSDIQMIDIWLILCQLVPFAQVVLLTAMLWSILRRRRRRRLKWRRETKKRRFQKERKLDQMKKRSN